MADWFEVEVRLRNGGYFDKKTLKINFDNISTISYYYCSDLWVDGSYLRWTRNLIVEKNYRKK